VVRHALFSAEASEQTLPRATRHDTLHNTYPTAPCACDTCACACGTPCRCCMRMLRRVSCSGCLSFKDMCNTAPLSKAHAAPHTCRMRMHTCRMRMHTCRNTAPLFLLKRFLFLHSLKAKRLRSEAAPAVHACVHKRAHTRKAYLTKPLCYYLKLNHYATN
jgi:hypothetical protein